MKAEIAAFRWNLNACMFMSIKKLKKKERGHKYKIVEIETKIKIKFSKYKFNDKDLIKPRKGEVTCKLPPWRCMKYEQLSSNKMSASSQHLLNFHQLMYPTGQQDKTLAVNN